MAAKGFCDARLGGMRNVMAGYAERGELSGLVTLVSRGEEVHVEAFGATAYGQGTPMGRDTIFRIASMTKPITAAAAMILAEECKLRLDEPVDRLLPELSNLKVLRQLDSQLDDTVPANRSITLRDLLTFRSGLGAIMAPPGRYPIQRAIEESGLAAGPNPPLLPPDEWIRRIGELPLAYQPGAMWMYHTGSDILGVLIARASGQPLDDFLRERIFEPLGMKDTGFHVPSDKLHRLPVSYGSNPVTGEMVVHDEPGNSRWGGPPVFQSGGGGLVSTVDDYLSFCRMMLHRGRLGNVRILSRPAVELMTRDHLTPEQKMGPHSFLGDNLGWGFGVSVATRQEGLGSSPGRFGWDGGIGTSGYVDPKEELIGILMTQRLMESPVPPKVFEDFWTSAYQAIED